MVDLHDDARLNKDYFKGVNAITEENESPSSHDVSQSPMQHLPFGQSISAVSDSCGITP